MTTKITEREGTRIKLPETKGDKYKVRLMGWEPGADVVEGSSADYPVDRIKRDFAEAFPKGTRMKANHDGICEMGGDIRRIMAKTVDTPWSEADGMYAHIVVPDEYAPFVENFADVIGLSISAGCELQYEQARDEDGQPMTDANDEPIMVPKRSERGALVVDRFLSLEESPYNSVDFVEAPGADGRIVARALESAKTLLEGYTIREAATFIKGTIKPIAEDSEATPPRSNQEEHMTDEERAALVAEVTESVRASVLEAIRPAGSDSEQPTLSATVEAVVAAGLTEQGRAEVYARLERGEALEAAITAETTREAGIEAEVERRMAERASAPQTEGFFGFGYTSDDQSGKPLGTESKGAAKAELDEQFDKITGGN